MRQFVVLGHTATTDPDVPLDDLAGGAGRLDVLCRCVGAAFCLSHGLREDVRLHLVLRDRLTIRFEGSELRYLSPDERNVASLIGEALEAAKEAVGHQAVESTPGIYVAKRGFGDVVADLDGPVLELHADGGPVTDLAAPPSPVFVLSDHEDVTDEEAALLDEAADERVSLGPERLHAEHAITIAHNYLDTAGYTRY